MDDKAKRAALGKMRSRRLEALAAQLRQEIALRLLNKNGSVSAEEAGTAFSEEWLPPSEEQLRGHLAQKARAGAEFVQRLLDHQLDEPGRLRAKIAKYEAMLADTKAALVTSEAACDEAQGKVDEMVELAEYAVGLGDPSLAPEPTGTAAHAQAATVGVKAGSES